MNAAPLPPWPSMLRAPGGEVTGVLVFIRRGGRREGEHGGGVR